MAIAVNATSVLVVIVTKLPDKILKIGARRHPEAIMRRVELENCGDWATADRLKMCRRSALQFPRSWLRSCGLRYPPSALPELPVLPRTLSLMQCEKV